MDRVIFEVDAWIVDANGTFNRIQDFPKRFDSRSSGDPAGTERRAKAEFHNQLGLMYANQAGRQIQTVVMRDVRGVTQELECIGKFQEETEPAE